MAVAAVATGLTINKTKSDFSKAAAKATKKQQARQEYVKMNNLTNCVSGDEIKSTHPAFANMGQTWVEKKVWQSVKSDKTLVCSYKAEPLGKTKKEMGKYIPSHNIISLTYNASSLTATHEVGHKIQYLDEPNYLSRPVKLYQKVMAAEVGATCLSTISALQTGNKNVFKAKRTSAISQILEKMSKTNPAVLSTLKAPLLKIDAAVLDELMKRSLKDKNLFSYYKNEIHKQTLASVAKVKKFDFSSLTKRQIEKALVGDLYPKGSFPKTVSFIYNMGKELNSTEALLEHTSPYKTAQKPMTAKVNAIEPKNG